MNKKVYGILFGLGVFCMLGLSLTGMVSAADSITSRHKAWRNEEAGSWGFEVSYGQIGVGTSVSWENSHGAMVAGAVGTYDENQIFGTIGSYAVDLDETASNHDGFWEDHEWEVKEHYYLPEAEHYIEETGQWRQGYYTTQSYNMVHHHWVFGYKVKHTNIEWEETHSTTYDDEYILVVGVQCSSGAT